MLNLPVFLGKHARHISLLSVETVQRCSEEMYQSHESEIFRDSRRKQRIFVEKLSGTFCRRSGTFLPFFARPRAIALGSKPPLVTRIARTGLGTRLYNTINWRDTTYLDSEDDRTGCRNISKCQCQQQQCYSGLRLLGRWNSTYCWNDSWI